MCHPEAPAHPIIRIFRTLLAIGTPQEHLDSTLRFSLSVMNTPEELKEAADALAQLLPFLRKYTRR